MRIHRILRLVRRRKPSVQQLEKVLKGGLRGIGLFLMIGTGNMKSETLCRTRRDKPSQAGRDERTLHLIGLTTMSPFARERTQEGG